MGLPKFIDTNIETWLKSFNFSTSIKTRFGETDAFGHINNVNYFSYFEQARLDYFEHFKLFELLNVVDSFKESLSENLVVTANLECHYLAELYYGQIIDVFVRTARIGNSSFDLEYAILERENGKLSAVGRGAIVYINRIKNRSEALPDIVKEVITEYENIPM